MLEFHGLQESTFDQFRYGRRRADVERVLGWLRRRPADLLCYEQVRDRRVPRGSRELELQEISVESIVGSVGRCSDYTRGFMPLKDSDRLRWTRVLEAAEAAQDLPPIHAFRIGQVHFVDDGHHRVSVARRRGQSFIAATVVEIQI